MPHEPHAEPGVYGVREAAQISGLTPTRVRAYARAGVLEPERGPRGELRFRFRDLSFLRRLKELGQARIPPRRVTRALARLRERGGDPADVPLSAAGGEVVVRDGPTLWSPESGQVLFDFDADGAPRRVVTLTPRAAAEAADPVEAESWYRLGCELEESDRDRAREAYLEALIRDPEHADAHLNLGCLHHEDGKLADAETHYRAALRASPGDATARFDLAVLLDDAGRLDEARRAYEAALAADPACAEAHYNLARLCEHAGDEPGAVRHLIAYRRLAREP